MLNTEDALLRAIQADPDDDTPRLVYADFLEERGDPRGEFIRVQVKFARMDQSDPEYGRLVTRSQELLRQHGATWNRQLGLGDAESSVLSVTRRGFVESLHFAGEFDLDLGILDRFPALRTLRVENGEVSHAGLRRIAQLSQLDSLIVYGVPIDEAGLVILEALPCWTRVVVEAEGIGDDRLRESTERRVAKLAELPQEERHRAAVRYVLTCQHGHALGLAQPIKEVTLAQVGVTDSEMRFLAELPGLEQVHISEAWHLTNEGLRQLAGLPHLRSLELYDTAVTSIAPLTGRLTLEELTLSPDYSAPMTDDDMEGLETLINLRKLTVRFCEISDPTVERLRPLTRLRELDLDLNPLAVEDCLGVLANMTEMTRLALGGDHRYSDFCLRHLSGMAALETLTIGVDAGQGERFRHLSGLRCLRQLFLHGNAVTDTALRQLAPLKQLRTIMAQNSSVTPNGARWLADQLPDVTIILNEQVIKSAKPSRAFRRVQLKDAVSALLPEGWHERTHYLDSAGAVHLGEDGWEGIGGWSGTTVGPAEIGLSVWDRQGDTTADAVMLASVNNNAHANPNILERDVAPFRGAADVASCVYRNDFGQHFLCVAMTAEYRILLDCRAPASRFDEFRPLFEYVARSVRIGGDLGTISERIEVPAEQLG